MTQYHVSLNSQGYILDLDRYVKRIREPFAAKQSQGSVAVGDLRGPEQVLVISDWSGGDGYVQHDEDEPGRHLSAVGVDGFTVPGALRLGPYVSVVQTTADNRIFCMAVYGGKLYAGSGGGNVYSWDGSTWATARATGSVPLAMEEFLGKLYVGLLTGAVSSFDGTTWTAAAFTAGGRVDVLLTHFREAAQYLYVGASTAGSGGVGRLYYWDGAALSLGQFDPEEPYVLGGAVWREKAYFGCADLSNPGAGLYSLDSSGSGGNFAAHYRSRAYEGVACLTVAADRLYVGDQFQGKVWAWDGNDLALVRSLSTVAGAYTQPINALIAWLGGLWVPYVESGGTLGLLRYDPVTRAWSRPVTGQTGDLIDCLAVYGGDLYVGTLKAGAARVYRVSASLYGGSGQLVSGLISFGLPGVSKLLRSVTLVTAAMPSGQSVQVEYQLEGTGGWTSLGTLSATGATTATYSFAANVTCRQVAFRLTLTGSAGSSSSPVVYELAVRYVPRPAITREWELPVVLEGTPELPLVTLDGEASPLTAAQFTSALWTAAGAAGPVTLVDLDGTSYSVYVQNVREELGKLSQRRAASVGYQRLGVVTLVEAA